jgi:hypothetical protein
LFGNKTDITGKADEVIIDFDKKTIPGFNGDVTLYSWNNNIKKSKVYANGKNTLVNVLVSKGASNKKNIQSAEKKLNSCIDWYWEYYQDGTFVGEQYAFTTCDGDCEEEPFVFRNTKGLLSVKTNCGGGSFTSPSTPPPPPGCDGKIAVS